jgi:hypothetical protein
VHRYEHSKPFFSEGLRTELALRLGSIFMFWVSGWFSLLPPSSPRPLGVQMPVSPVAHLPRSHALLRDRRFPAPPLLTACVPVSFTFFRVRSARSPSIWCRSASTSLRTGLPLPIGELPKQDVVIGQRAADPEYNGIKCIIESPPAHHDMESGRKSTEIVLDDDASGG